MAASVSEPGWKELFKSEDVDFHFAVFRQGDYLIFWATPRQTKPRGKMNMTEANTVLTTRDDRLGALNYRLIEPQGALKGDEQAKVYKIPGDFQGEIVVAFSARLNGQRGRRLLSTQVHWLR